MNTFDDYVNLYEKFNDPDPGFDDSVDEKAEIEQANAFAKTFKMHLKAFKAKKKFKSIEELATYVDKALMLFDMDWNEFAKNNDRLYGLRLYFTFKKIEKACIKACMNAAEVIRTAGNFVFMASNAEIGWERHNATLPNEMVKYYRKLPTAKKSKVFLDMLEKMNKLYDAIPYDANLSRVRKPLL